jgi:hypothetical protein
MRLKAHLRCNKFWHSIAIGCNNCLLSYILDRIRRSIRYSRDRLRIVILKGGAATGHSEEQDQGVGLVEEMEVPEGTPRTEVQAFIEEV